MACTGRLWGNKTRSFYFSWFYFHKIITDLIYLSHNKYTWNLEVYIFHNRNQIFVEILLILNALYIWEQCLIPELKLYLEGITIKGYQKEIKLMMKMEIHSWSRGSIFVMNFTSKSGNSGSRSCLVSWSYLSLPCQAWARCVAHPLCLDYPRNGGLQIHSSTARILIFIIHNLKLIQGELFLSYNIIQIFNYLSNNLIQKMFFNSRIPILIVKRVEKIKRRRRRRGWERKVMKMSPVKRMREENVWTNGKQTLTDF